jgi:LPPG:FO 2-phospho-L-lactate transferase
MTSAAIAAHYGDLIDAYVLDEVDWAEAGAIDRPTLVTRTLMRDEADKCRLAADILAFADDLG